jgi:histidine triad (HIT) family protein
MNNDIFCKIIRGEIPASVYYESDEVLVIKNINPEARFHALIIPKKHLEMDQLKIDDQNVLGSLLLAASLVAKKEGLKEGYRLIINNGPDSGQEIEHLHVHMLAGENLGPNLCR